MRGTRAFTIANTGLWALLLAANAMAQTRLPTDAPLRSGMESIRASIIEHHTLITHRRLPVAMARSFAGDVGQTVALIREESAVPADARAALDPLLVTIDTSAQTIGAGGDGVRQINALFAMSRALEAYGQSFDHPDWKPLQER